MRWAVLVWIVSTLASCLGLAPAGGPVASSPAAPEEASPSPSRGDELVLTEVGKASYVRASLGDEYLALPRHPRGTLVRVCGEAGCVTRRSTDVGPDQGVFPDRIVDLSKADFRTVSGEVPEVAGVVVVTVEFLEGAP